MHRLNNQRELGAEDWKRALALREQLVREHPDDFLSAATWLRACKTWATGIARRAASDERAEESYRRALAIQNALAREAPDAARPRTDLPVTPFALDPARIRYDLAFTYFNLAVLYRDDGRSAKAAEVLQQALDHLGRLVREQPGRAGYRQSSGEDPLRAGPPPSSRWPDRPRGRGVAQVPGAAAGAGPRASGRLGITDTTWP